MGKGTKSRPGYRGHRIRTFGVGNWTVDRSHGRPEFEPEDQPEENTLEKRGLLDLFDTCVRKKDLERIGAADLADPAKLLEEANEFRKRAFMSPGGPTTYRWLVEDRDFPKEGGDTEKAISMFIRVIEQGKPGYLQESGYHIESE